VFHARLPARQRLARSVGVLTQAEGLRVTNNAQTGLFTQLVLLTMSDNLYQLSQFAKKVPMVFAVP
jgi:hypothetical protein